MSEIKFTDDEMKKIQDLSDKSGNITNRFGQLAIAKINLEKQSEQVEEQEFKLHEEFDALKKEENEVLQAITDKYGPGNLNPQTGVYTQTTQPEEQK